MTLEDPFFVVKDELARILFTNHVFGFSEVFKALNKTRGLYLRWSELRDESAVDNSALGRDEIEWTNTELKNSLRSIEWDLEDLEDTIDIVEKNPNRFKIDNKELTVRKNFINNTREEVKSMKDRISMNNKIIDDSVRQPLINQSPVRVTNNISYKTTKYLKLENELDSPQRSFITDTLGNQNNLVREHNDHLEAIGKSLTSLKSVSKHISVEIDEQSGMLDEFGTEMENTESKLDNTLKKVSKVLHLSNDGRQWTAIIVLSITLIVVIVIFINSF